MTTLSYKGGASIDARTISPRLNLTPVIRTLNQLFLDKNNNLIKQYIVFDPNSLKIHLSTNYVLQRAIYHPNFKAISATDAPSASNVIMDMPKLPSFGITARMGGSIADNPLTLSNDVLKLYDQINEQLETIPDEAFQQLCINNTENYIKEFAKSISASYPKIPKFATIKPLAFTNFSDKEIVGKDVARLFYAREHINAENWIDGLKKDIESHLKQQGYDDDHVEAIADAIEVQRNNPNSQITRFIHFLDDIALSRVRLKVVINLMSSFAEQSNHLLFKQYIANIESCYQLFGGSEAESLFIDAEKEYGDRASIEMADYLVNVYAYKNLPIWADNTVQLFENMDENAHGFKTTRDVCYRFKVNGLVVEQEAGQAQITAFENRLNKLGKKLIELEDNNSIDITQNFKYEIGALVFLALVIPSDDPLENNMPIKEKATILANMIKEKPYEGFKTIHNMLHHRIGMMDSLGKEFISLLRTKSSQVLTNTKKINSNYVVSILKSILNKEAIEGFIGKEDNADIFKKVKKGEQSTVDGSKDSSVWLKHITITVPDLVENSLTSYEVSMKLGEKTLREIGETKQYEFERDLSNPVLPLRFLALEFDKSKNAFEYCYDYKNTGFGCFEAVLGQF